MAEYYRVIDFGNMKKKILKWEMSGILFVFLCGALLHFVFEWSDESGIVGAFASVNESVWEHFKQGFWPMCLFAALEYGFLGRYTGNFMIAKGIAVFLIPVITALLFYAYTAATGTEILIVDILIFALAVTIGQLISYRVMVMKPLPAFFNYLGWGIIMLIGLILVLFTFFPPHLPILMDHNSGTYGIPWILSLTK